jgi:Xaa-Pro aminopeptidase
MVMTMEPGLYIDESPNVDKKWWGMGVRIEDDIVITAEGCRVLSAACPKTVVDIEAAMAE